jgi:primosomal protein N'
VATPSPLEKAKSLFRYQIMLRTRRMSVLSRRLAELAKASPLPDDITMTIDIDPVDLM